jgi:CheY-like chemotaxis protein
MPNGGTLLLETMNIEINESFRTAHTPNIKTGPYVLLAVTDSGHGIDETIMNRIFDPFFTTKEPGEGTGLGLSLVYGITNQFGGFVNVYSEVGIATTFKIYLPRYTDGLIAIETATIPDTTTLTGDETILLVEDDQILRNLSIRILEGFGYTVLSASNGKEALELNQWYSGPIDLLISDMIMPKMGGFELVNQIITARSNLKIMIMSGYTDQVLSSLERLPQYKAFLQKPFTPLDFVHKVRELLDAPES